MNSSRQADYQKFNPSPPSAPPAFDPSRTATGIPVTSANQFYSANPQPPPVHQIHPGAEETPWSTGLCDCCSDVPNCCITCWCPCITFGLISEIVDRGSSSCVANGAIYALLAYFTGCGCIYSCLYRTKMRHQYRLKEGPCGDCLLHFCCEPCALCQEYRELQNRGFNVSLGWQANVESQNQGVAMAPNVPAGMYR